MPKVTPVQRARVDSEVRALADDASAGLAKPWVESVRRASVSHLDDVADRLDVELARADLGVESTPGWAGLVRVLQWVLLVAAGIGLLWTAALVVSGTLGEKATPKLIGIALPVLLLVGGVVLGVVLALVCRGLVAAAARSRAEGADSRLRQGVSRVSRELVVTPVEAELAAYTTVREGLATARK